MVGLIQKDKFRVPNQSACHGDPLLLPPGQLRNPGIGFLLESHQRHRLFGFNPFSIETPEHPKRLENAQLVPQPGFLQRDSQFLTQFVVAAGTPTHSQHFDLARGCGDQAFQDLDCRRLPRPVRAEQPETLAPLDFQIESIDGIHGLLAALIPFEELFAPDSVRHEV